MVLFFINQLIVSFFSSFATITKLLCISVFKELLTIGSLEHLYNFVSPNYYPSLPMHMPSWCPVPCIKDQHLSSSGTTVRGPLECFSTLTYDLLIRELDLNLELLLMEKMEVTNCFSSECQRDAIRL